MLSDVVILDPQPADVAAELERRRPDLDLHVGAEASPPGRPFALIAFDPGDAVNRFEAAAHVHCGGAGTDKLLRALAFTPPVLTRTIGRMGDQMAEYVLTYVLAERQQVAARAAHQAAREWRKREMLPVPLFDRKALVFGTGAIARTIATRLSQFGMPVTGVSRSGKAKPPFGACYPLDDLPRSVLADADVVVLCLPNLPHTTAIIDREILAGVEGALLLNVGRGEVLHEPALIEALDRGALRGAVLDVFAEEPLPSSSALWSHPRIVATPHVSGVTLPADVADAFLAARAALDDGQTPPDAVDPARGY